MDKDMIKKYKWTYGFKMTKMLSSFIPKNQDGHQKNVTTKPMKILTKYIATTLEVIQTCG